MKAFNRIFIIDDDPTTIYINETIINEMELNLPIVSFEAPDGALKFLSGNNFFTNDDKKDLIILDLLMPSMSGFEFLDKLQNKENFAVIMLTSSAHKENIEESKKYNVIGYIEKPLNQQKINFVLNVYSMEKTGSSK